MATLTRWDPFAEMQRLTDQMFRGWGVEQQRTFAPAVDIYEDDDAIFVRAELPGVKAEDVSIDLENDVLTIAGERKLEREDKREGYHRIESSFGVFSRSFALPESVDTSKVEAEMNEGVLNVRIPKRPEVAQHKRIPVKPGAKQMQGEKISTSGVQGQQAGQQQPSAQQGEVGGVKGEKVGGRGETAKTEKT